MCNPRLTLLPPGLLALVAEHTNPQDLLALRAVCHKISKTSFGAFSKVFFSKPSHLCTSFGLKTLVEITSHPELI